MIKELSSSTEHGGLAGLARDLMAAVHIPRAISTRESLPVGGISDITNRGSLDRLLLSELTHNDLTLATRIAVGEALYYRRESPPSQPPITRVLLLDAGIKLWGTPRIFAAAVALAFGATAGKNSDLLAFRPSGDCLEPVDLTSHEGLQAHLACLEPDPHPGSVIERFLDRLADVTDIRDVEPILVTHADTVADPGFQASLADLKIPVLYMASVDTGGNYQLVARTRFGRKHLGEARLKLDDLMDRRAPVKSTGQRSRLDLSLPSILFQNPFPLRLPHAAQAHRSRHHPRLGVVAMTADCRLMHWRRSDGGAYQLTDRLPRGRMLWMQIEESGWVHLLVGSGASGVSRLSVHVDSGESSKEELYPRVGAIGHVERVGDALLLYGKHSVEAHGMFTGSLIDRHSLRFSRKPRSGRVILDRARDVLCLLEFNGQAFGKMIDIPGTRHPGALTAVIERDGIDGFTLLDTDAGEARQVGHDSTPTRVLQFDPRFSAVRESSHDGQRHVLADPKSTERCLIHLRTGEVNKQHILAGDFHRWVEPAISSATLVTRNLRKHLAGVFIDRAGKINFVSRKRRASLRLSLSEQHDRIVLVSLPPPSLNSGTPPIAFEACHKPAGVGYTMKAATWPDGSRIFLDSRGLLHLKSSNPGLPEITLILSGDNVSGWSSEGRYTGDPYFRSDGLAVDADLFYVGISHFIAGLS